MTYTRRLCTVCEICLPVNSPVIPEMQWLKNEVMRSYTRQKIRAAWCGGGMRRGVKGTPLLQILGTGEGKGVEDKGGRGRKKTGIGISYTTWVSRFKNCSLQSWAPTIRGSTGSWRSATCVVCGTMPRKPGTLAAARYAVHSLTSSLAGSLTHSVSHSLAHPLTALALSLNHWRGDQSWINERTSQLIDQPNDYLVTLLHSLTHSLSIHKLIYLVNYSVKQSVKTHSLSPTVTFSLARSIY